MPVLVPEHSLCAFKPVYCNNRFSTWEAHRLPVPQDKTHRLFTLSKDLGVKYDIDDMPSAYQALPEMIGGVSTG